MKKRAFTLLLTLVMCLSTCVPAMAADVESSREENPSVVEYGSRALDTEAAIEVLMKKADCSYSEALSLCEQAAASGQDLVERWVVCSTVMNLKIEIGCLVEVQSGGGHSSFGEVRKTWSFIRNSGIYTWDPAYSNAEVGPPAKSTISFSTRGTLEVDVDIGGSLEKELIASGFTAAGSVGQTIHYRYIASLAGTYKIGDFLQ